MRGEATVWTAWGNVLLGLFLLSTPITFQLHGVALIVSDWICAVLLVILGLMSRSGKSGVIPWLGAGVGLWLQAAPLLFWTDQPVCYVLDTTVGVLAVAFFVIIPPLPGKVADEGPSIPPGWSYNPSSWAQRIPILALVAVCWLLSRYLTAYQLGFIDTIWDPFFDTEAVITSKVSRMFPVSDAGLGALAYTLEFLFICQGSERRWRTSPWMTILSGFFVVPVSLVSVLLIILQPLSVGAWCTTCLVIAICALWTIPLGVDELILALQYVRRSKEKPLMRLLFEGGECPRAGKDLRSPSPAAPTKEILIASCWGMTLPLNLLALILLGIWWTVTPALFAFQNVLLRDLDYILGPLSIVVATVSTAELLRSARWINLLLAIVTAVVGFRDLNHLLIASLVLLFSIPRGKIHEQAQFS